MMLLLTAMLLAVSAGAQMIDTNLIPRNQNHAPYSSVDHLPWTNGWINRCGVSMGVQNMDSLYTLWCDPTVAIPGTNIVLPHDGMTDCSMAIKAMTALQPPWTYISVPSGVYWATNGGTIGSYCQLRCAGKYGPNQTIWVYNHPSTPGVSQPPQFWNISTSQGNNLLYAFGITNADFAKGATNFSIPYLDWKYVMGNRSGAVPGDVTNLCGYVCQKNDTNLVSLFGYGGQYAPVNSTGSSAMSQMVHITKIVTNGNLVTMTTEEPSIWTWALTNSPQFYPLTKPCTYASIEHCAVFYMNTNQGLSGSCFNMTGAYQSGVWDCMVYNNVENAFTHYTCYRCSISQCGVDFCQYTSSGQAYLYEEAGPNSDNVVEACWGWGGRHILCMEGGGSGCAYAYNACFGGNNHQESAGYVTDEVDIHAAGPFMNVLSENYFHKLRLDSEHGSDDYFLVTRNIATMGLTNTTDGLYSWLADTNLPVPPGVGFPHTFGHNVPYTSAYGAFACDMTNYESSFIGNVCGLPALENFPAAQWLEVGPGNPWAFGFGFGLQNASESDGEGTSVVIDPTVATRTFLDGNYDFKSNQVVNYYGTNRNLPADMVYAARPFFLSNNIAWPTIGPDVTNCNGVVIYVDTNIGPAVLDFKAFTNSQIILASGTGSCGGTGGGAGGPVTNQVQIFWMRVKNDMPALWKNLTQPQKS